MVSHTPGPWEAQAIERDGQERGSCFVVGSNMGGLIGAAHAWPTEIDTGNFERVKANARLIAAAPDMLESLRNLVGLAQIRGHLHEYRAALNDARAVIAKATGTHEDEVKP